jgi:hypothetical protein
MLRGLVIVLIALNVSATHLFAEQPATTLGTSVARVKFDFTESRASRGTPRPQRKSPQRLRHDAAIFAGLTTLGVFAGMALASKVALPCHCDDPESVVARGALVGGAAGAVAGVIINLR